MRLAFCDRAGNRSTAERRFLLTRDRPTATLVSQSKPVFSPNAAGRATTATFRSFTGLLLEGSVHTDSASGLQVRSLGTSVGSTGVDVAFVWDGRDDQGAFAPEGRYVIRVHVRDGCGGSSDTSATVVVDRTPPVVAINLPLPGQSAPSSLDVTGSATDAHFHAYELSYGVGDNPSSWLHVDAGVRSVLGGFLGRWDPPGTSGHYTLRLTATDQAENEAVPYLVTVDANPGQFLGRLAATPALFSPNGDGRRETTTLEYDLRIDAQVSLEIRDAQGVVLRRLESAAPRTAGGHALVWDGRSDSGDPAPEGDHVLWVRAGDGLGASQEHAVRVSIDRIPPRLLIERPTSGSFLSRQATVHGSVTDPNLNGYTFQALAPGGAIIDLAQGTEPQPDGDLASLSALDEAPYVLRATATDAAENAQHLEVPFVVDSLAPVVRLIAPPDAAVLPRTGSPVLVTGRAEDANPDTTTLRFGAGPAPSVFIEFPSTVTAGLVAGSWSVGSLPDGPYTLSLRATDRAGQAAEARRLVSVDSTAPTAVIASPAEGAFVVTEGPINGTAADANLASWTLEAAPGPADSAYRWNELGRGASPVDDALLVHWMPLPADGTHTLRLTVRDRADLVSTALRTVTVDTTPPAAPTGLVATVERNGTAGDIRLTWNANTEPDLAGYRIFRDGAVLDTSLLTEPRTTDAGRPEGRYLYRVVAVDRAGNSSPPAASTVSVDLTPPTVDLIEPREGAVVSGSVDVRGTAFSADDFKEYRLLVGVGTQPATWTELRRSTLPVVAGTLGSWTGILDGPYTLALEAEDTSGNRARVTRVVVVDTQPPLAPALTALAPSATDALNATWQASPSPDVAGYLVYRNGRIANAPGVVLGDLGGYMVPGPTYVDAALPDGRHCYRVVARDEAGNSSPPSNELCHSLDNRPPHATILQPADGTRFGFPVRVVADTPDTDVVFVQFQIRRSGEPDWAALNAPLARPPFETTLDPAALTPGAYELRALARDEGGREDPAPQAIVVMYGDVTAPAPPSGLAALTSGADVRLTWTASPEPDFASYNVWRDGVLVATGVTEPTLSETELALDTYEYTVTALDNDGNESRSSNPAEAVVYRLRLEPPAWPVTSAAAANLGGTGARVGTTVRILRDELVVGAAPSAGSVFRVDGVALAPEGNILRARGDDTSGNRSLPSDEVVVISNAAPAGVAGLTAEVDGHAVSLAWGPVTEPDLFGYMVRRDGQRLTAPSRRAEAAEVVPPDASAAFDGNPATSWRPSSAPATWSVRITEPGLVERIHLRFAQGEPPVAAYKVFAGWEGRLVLLVRVEHNTEAVADHLFPMPFATDTIAIELGSVGALAEVEIYAADVVPPATTLFREEDVADGAHTYRVSAIDRYGAEGPAAEVAAPVGELLPPGAPTSLTVTVASRRDAVLAWTSNPEADLDHYVVLRDQVRIATTIAPAYVDPGLRPGTYVYTVLAVDRGGNESAPSNPAAAVIEAVAPAAPVILLPTDAAHPLVLDAVTTDVAGRTDPDTIVELELNGESHGFTEAQPTWFPTAGPPVTGGGGLAVSPDGRWLATEEPGSGVRLHDLSNGSDGLYAPAGYAQFLFVRFSPDSGRLALVALPASGPRAVIILDLASREATAAYSGPVYELAWSPGGDRLVIGTSESSGTQSQVLELGSGASHPLSANPFAVDHGFRWSPDGRNIAFLRSWSGAAEELWLVDPETGSEARLDDQPAPYPPSWSADGRKIAYTSAGTAPRVRVRDVATGALLQTIGTGDQQALDPRFDPAGRWLSFVQVETDAEAGVRRSLVAENLAVGARTEPVALDGAESPPILHEWSGQRLAIAGSSLVFYAAANGFHFQAVPLAPGQNLLVARAFDSAPGLWSPDSETVRLTVAASAFPDLTVSSVQAYPSVPIIGEPVQLSARLVNLGQLDLADVALRLTLNAPDGGTVIDQTAIVSSVPAGGSVVVSTAWTPAAAGVYRLRAEADPDGSIVESNEGNNEASRDVVVGAEPELVLRLRSDRPEYGARAPALLDVQVMNGGPSLSGTLRTSVEDAAGREVALLDSREIALAYGQDLQLDVPWNTGTTYAGDYTFRVRALEGESERASASQAFRILPVVSLFSRLVPDRPTIAAGSTATFMARVENRSPNSPLDGASLRLRLRAEGSPGPIVFETERTMPRLVPGAVFEASLAWPQAAPAGSYTAELAVLSGARLVLSDATARLVVDSSVAVLGTLSLEPAAVLQGQAVEARLTVRPTGALVGYPVQVEVTFGPEATVLVRQTLLLDLPPAQTTSAAVTLQTNGLAPGRYAVRLRGGDPAATLAMAVLTVHGPIAPPSLDAPASGAVVQTSHPLLRVNNGSSSEAAPLSYEFELFADSGLTQALAGVAGMAETPGRTAWTVETRLGEDHAYYWRARATDGFSSSPWTSIGWFTVDEIDLPPSSPVVDSPLPGARVATRQPRLGVTNARDPEGRPLTYEFRVATDAPMTDVLSAVSEVPEGSGQTFWLLPLLLEEDAIYYWSARASDGPNFSPWSVPVFFQVDSDNLSPSAPTPLHPSADAFVETFAPELVVANSIDPEDDPLTYRFQIDVTPTFDSPSLQLSGDVTPDLSETTWTPGQSLAEDTLYHWRAGAFDGRTFGPWAGSRFFVNTRNDAPGTPVPLDPVDGRTLGTPTPTLMVRNTTDPEGDVLTYAFAVRDRDGALVASADAVPGGLDETAWVVTVALAEDQPFTWSARASDGQTPGEWSEPESFRINAVLEPPTAPTPQSPAEGSTVTSRRPALALANATSPEGLPLTYAFELYAVASDGAESLFDSASLVPEAGGSTSWTPTRDLADGAYKWRARASDPGQAGSWSNTVPFTVAVDVRPAPPTGLRAVPGDGLVYLTWNANPEPDVTGYRVYRALVSGGPYAAVAVVSAPALTDPGRTNGVTVYYVVAALDARFESDHSAEVAATPVAPPPAVIPAEVRLRPASISSECLLSGACDDGHGLDALDRTPAESFDPAVSTSTQGPVLPILECVVENAPASFTAFFGYRNENDFSVSIAVGSSNRFTPDPRGRGQTTKFAAGRTPYDRPAFAVDFTGGNLVWTLSGRTSTASPASARCPSPPPPRDACPLWLYATVELPGGLDPATIDVHTVRILGVIAADPSYRVFADRDGDGITEVELRFPFESVRSSLAFGANALALTGRAAGVELRGTGTLTVAPVAVNAWTTPRTLSRRHPSGEVQVRLTFRSPLRAHDVAIATVRLNDFVAVSRVVSANGAELVLKFPRPVVLGVLPTGAAVEVRVTGHVGQFLFTARDSIEVTE